MEFFIGQNLLTTKLMAFMCFPGPNENPYSEWKYRYIEKSIFRAMEVGHHTLMVFFPI